MRRPVLRLLGSTLLVLVAFPFVHSQSDCSQAESCDLCVGDSMLNLTDCVWRLCPNGNDTGACVADGGDAADTGVNCSWTRVSELCTGDESSTNPPTEFSQAKFDMSSFVGGIVLVLSLQAGGLIAMRLLKSKEQSTYDPIEQPQ
ncbi:CD164 sialomucin-like 2 protein isoform 2-T2 [Menidia menidia]